ncbi:MAG TPA: hypothetical protein VD927_02355 [Chryseosolibacter sp.]|nr:hypothetical protein [Chryseosolibacter sp.]
MKKIVVVLMLSIISSQAFANISGIAIQSEKDITMQVYVNGKLYNKQPGTFVRIKSLPGLFHVEVRVQNPYDGKWYLVKKDITVKRGYEFYYRMHFEKGKRPAIVEVRKYPVYSKYFLNPGLYNRNPVS